jgi:type VI secretion system protein ImpL
MKRYFGWMNRRWFWSLLGVLLLSLLVWYLGPLFVFGGNEMMAREVSRWRIIQLLLVIWGAYFAWVFFHERLAERLLMSGVSGRQQSRRFAGAKESQAEVAALSEGMLAAMAILRKANPGRRMSGQYLYRLPWYMVVGAADSGRTTMLSQSGLQFPLRDSLGTSSISGVGATLHCDWWFTDEAVLLDTAGSDPLHDNYTQVDTAAWGGFLRLLKKHRPLRPINGVIVTISVSDLLQQSEVERQAKERAIRTQINELHEQLGLRFPVYVVITKCDLLSGFVEFFESLGHEELSQVWGITFDLPQSETDNQSCSGLTVFPAEFKALERQLLARVLERIQQEPDLARRGLLFGFAQQFGNIKGVLESFLNKVFETNSYQEPTLLRGVYFTSGTQAHRHMNQAPSAFINEKGANNGHNSGRSYFITRLMREVIFKEAGLAGPTLKEQRRRRSFQRFGIAVIVVFSLLMALILTLSYERNRYLVSSADSQTAEIAKQVRDVAHVYSEPLTLTQALPLLNSARILPAGFASGIHDVSLLNGMGLYQGYKLGDGAVLLYQRMLRTTLLPHIVDSMENALRRGEANSQEFLYETLRVYLMLGYRQYFDAAAVQAWVELSWRSGALRISDVEFQQLSAHLGALLEAYDKQVEPVELDAKLIAQTRSSLARMPLSKRIYNRLKQQIVQLQLPEMTINNMAGRDVSSLLMRQSGEPLLRGVNGLYLVAGFRELTTRIGQVLTDMTKDSWVLNDTAAETVWDNVAVRAAVLELYYADYIVEWDSMLADIRPVALTSLNQASRVISTLAAPDSPLKLLLLAAARETTLEGLKDIRLSHLGDHTALTEIDIAQKKLSSVLGDANAPIVGRGNPVDRHFSELHKLVSGTGKGSIEEVFEQLKEVAQYFDRTEDARRNGTEVPSNETLARLGRTGTALIVPMSTVLRDIAGNGSALAVGNTRVRLNALWSTTGASFCRDAIAGRYPLVRNAQQDITADDFGRFFGPGGIIDDFFNKNLASYVDKRGAQWRWRKIGTTPLKIPQEVLNQFHYAADIREMFFGSGARHPSLRFDLKLLKADTALSNVNLIIDGQPVLYEAGKPSSFSPIRLPSGKGNDQVRLNITPAEKGELYSEGPWAWLRMMDKGLLETLQGELYQLTYKFGTSNVVYELKASSVINPFKPNAVSRFRCPSVL